MHTPFTRSRIPRSADMTKGRRVLPILELPARYLRNSADDERTCDEHHIGYWTKTTWSISFKLCFFLDEKSSTIAQST